MGTQVSLPIPGYIIYRKPYQWINTEKSNIFMISLQLKLIMPIVKIVNRRGNQKMKWRHII